MADTFSAIWHGASIYPGVFIPNKLLVLNGNISAYKLILSVGTIPGDLDAIARELAKLATLDVPVLWRPGVAKTELLTLIYN